MVDEYDVGSVLAIETPDKSTSSPQRRERRERREGEREAM
jgi:hypothetical protein